MSQCLFIVALLLGLLPAASSSACSRLDRLTEADHFNEARYVFHALLIRTELLDVRLPQGETPLSGDGADRRFLVNATYELKAVIKGDVPTRGHVTTPLAGGCTFPLIAGYEYIFFVEDWPAAFPYAAEAKSLGMISSMPSASQIVFGDSGLDEHIDRLRSYGDR